MKRIVMLSIAAMASTLLALPGNSAFAQSDKPASGTQSSGSSFNETSETDAPAFDSARDERLYRSVMAKLNDMQFAKGSGFIGESTNDKIDWFIVGGSFTDSRSGELEANFATMQGAESVARKIVEFESLDHGRGIKASWKVFDRYGGQDEATNALTDLKSEFEVYKKNRIAELRRQQQLRQQQAAARSRARSRSRRGSC